MSADPAPSSCVDLLAQMVAHDTVNPDFGGSDEGAARLAATLESIARDWGLSVRHQAVSDTSANLIITCEIDPAADWLWFESHLDTVATGGMNVPPFELTTSGSRLHGRGSCDTKGSGAAMLWALREYAADPVRTRNIGLAFVVDEESGMTGARALAESGLPSLPRVRGIIVGEPTRLRPVITHNGTFRWRSITRGVAAHSADPSRGRSAITAMMQVIDALESRFVPAASRTHPLTGRAAASVNVIRGGRQVNIIPDYCEIECDRRLVPGETLGEVESSREEALAGLEVEHDRESFVPPLEGAAESPFVRWTRAAWEACGFDGTPAGAPYLTDASFYAAAGIPALVVGPGDIAQAHTRDEWLDRPQLDAAIVLYGALMRLE